MDHNLYKVALAQWYTNMGLPISSLECYNALVDFWLWAKKMRASTVLLFMDNQATVCAVESGHAQDPLIRAVMREVWLLAATCDVDLGDMGTAWGSSHEIEVMVQTQHAPPPCPIVFSVVYLRLSTVLIPRDLHHGSMWFCLRQE